MEPPSDVEIAGFHKLALEEPARTLGLLREQGIRFMGDRVLESKLGALYIDIGSDLGDATVVHEGITLIATAIGQVPDSIIAQLAYNLANGYAALEAIKRRTLDYHFDPDNTHLIQAKCYYRKAIILSGELGNDTQCQLWVNYGNCLASLGRSIESIACYDQALRFHPNHPMAQGNLGIELSRFAYVSHHGTFLREAADMLASAIRSDQLGQYGGVHARQFFEQEKERIEAILAQQPADRRSLTLPSMPRSMKLREYIEFCSRHQLFLNLCLRCRECKRYARDDIALSITTDLDDDATFTRLSRVINQIKERYAFARFLLYQSKSPFYNAVSVDELTHFVDNLDYAVYGARVASLKVAFESGYSILDRIGYFINDYLRLGISNEAKIVFTTNGTVWREQGSSSLRTSIRDRDNRYLYGLYDLARDLDTDRDDPKQDGYLGHLRRMRNRLVHEYVIPHTEGTQWDKEADGPDCHVSYGEVVHRTISLLQTVKAAFIQLVAFIELEESKARRSTSGLVMSTYVPTYNARLHNSILG